MLLLSAAALASSPLRVDLPATDTRGAAWSDDSAHLLTWSPGRVDLRRGEDGRLLATHDVESVAVVAFSPDGRLAWIGGRGLARWDLATEQWTELTAAPLQDDAQELYVSPDGQRLVRTHGRTYSENGAWELLDTEGRPVAKGDVPKPATDWHRAVAFDPRPGAHRFVVAARSKVLAVDTTTGEVTELGQPVGGALVVAWRPDGGAIAVAGHGPRATLLDPDSGATIASSTRCRLLGEDSGGNGWADLVWEPSGPTVSGLCRAERGSRVITWDPVRSTSTSQTLGWVDQLAWGTKGLLAQGRVGRFLVGESTVTELGGPPITPAPDGDHVFSALGVSGWPEARVDKPVGGQWVLSSVPGWTGWKVGDNDRPLDLARLGLGAAHPTVDKPVFDAASGAWILGAALGKVPAGARLPLPGATHAELEDGPDGSPFVAVGDRVVALARWAAGEDRVRGLLAWNRQGLAWTRELPGDARRWDLVGGRILVASGDVVHIVDSAGGALVATLAARDFGGRDGWSIGEGAVLDSATNTIWVLSTAGRGIYDITTGKQVGTPPPGATLPTSAGTVLFATRESACVGPDTDHCRALALPEGRGVLAWRWSPDGGTLLAWDLAHDQRYAWTRAGDPTVVSPSVTGVEIQPGVFAVATGAVLHLARTRDSATLSVAVTPSGRLAAWTEAGVVQADAADVAVRDGFHLRPPTEAESGWRASNLVAAFVSGLPLPEPPP